MLTGKKAFTMKTKIDIRRAMIEHNISYATLSERTGIDKGNVSKLFNGNPTLNKLIAVADAIGVDVTDLFYPLEDQEDLTTKDAQPTVSNNNSENAEQHSNNSLIPITTFCPHCGAKVRVGVVLLPEK